jgi:micrococcal nuclease
MVLVLFLINYSFIDSFLEDLFLEGEIVIVERIVDGDTVIANNESVRLLGINTPERGERYYLEAKDFLEGIVLNKSVELKYGREERDRYGRILGYLFLNGENVNLELIENGLGNPYFPSGKDTYYLEFTSSWDKCVEKNINLCEISQDPCAKCISLEDFDNTGETIIFENICSFECDLSNWEIKDEGRKKYIFEEFILGAGEKVKIITGEGKDDSVNLFWKGENYVWTETGDTLFLRDRAGKLILYERT